MKKYIIGLLSILVIGGGVFFGWWKMNQEESFERKNKVTLTGQLEDKDGKLLSNQEIKLSNRKEEVTIKTDKSGYFYTHIEKNKEYALSSKEVSGIVIAENDDEVKTTMKKGSFFSGKKIDTEDSMTVLRNKAIELDPDNFIYEVSSDYKKVTIFSGKDKDEELDFLIGDIIAIPAQVDYISGLGLKVIGIEKESDNYILTTQQAAVEEVLKSFETKDGGYEMDMKDAYLELGEDVQLLDDTQQDMAWKKPKIDESEKISLEDELKLKFPKEENEEKKYFDSFKKKSPLLDKLSFEITSKIKGTVKFEVSIDFDQLDKATVLSTSSVELATDIQLDLESNEVKKEKEKIKLYNLKGPPIGPYIGIEVPISAKIEASGKVSLSQHIELPKIKSEMGLKKGELVTPLDTQITLSDKNKLKNDSPTDIETSFNLELGIGVGAKLNALTVAPLIELDIFGGPTSEVKVTSQLKDNTNLVDMKYGLMKVSLGMDPCLFGPVIELLLPDVEVEEEIELFSKTFGEKSYSWLIVGKYNNLLSVMDKAENLVKTEEPIDSSNYRKLVDLVEGKSAKNKGVSFDKMREEFDKKLPKVLKTKDEHQLFTTQKSIDEFTEEVEKLLSSVVLEIEETSKVSSKEFDQLPQATQFVVIQSLLDSRVLSTDPEYFNIGGMLGGTYYEDTQTFDFQIHSGAGLGHPGIIWSIQPDEVQLIQSVHRSRFDEYVKRVPINKESGTVSKTDLFKLYKKFPEQYDKWGVGATIKIESKEPEGYLEEPEAIKDHTIIEQITLPSIEDIEATER